ncbi:hypothetical protein E2C01_066212 [Portunus trituberculatus]|uniref:Uncharacterized protein n=1 Tax=Portunus trituberculatus TaxID=210409 RepID=A0A5B7HHM1_PORTR|nr:hypothetical protein [Portunus trituberculatus]
MVCGEGLRCVVLLDTYAWLAATSSSQLTVQHSPPAGHTAVTTHLQLTGRRPSPTARHHRQARPGQASGMAKSSDKRS